MNKSFVNVNSITYAQRGRDILTAKGYSVHFEKTHSPAQSGGCGYTIYSDASQEELENLLTKAGIKIVPVRRGEI